MSLRYIKNLLPNIRTKKYGMALLPICTVMIVFLMMLSVFMYRRQLIQINFEKIETSLTDALLAGGVINSSYYGRTGKVMIQEGDEPSAGDSFFNNSYRLFSECLKANLRLNDGYEAEGDNGIIGTVKIIEYRVYNYIESEDGFFITEIGLNNGQAYSMRYNLNENVYVNANDSLVEIKETSVYAKIGFRFRLASRTAWLAAMPEDLFEKDYTLTRLISIAH